MRKLNHFSYRIFGTQHVGYLSNCQQFCVAVDKLRKHVQFQRTVLIERYHSQFCTGAFAEHLPGNNIGVVLHGRDNNVISGLHRAHSPAVCHEVDPFGGAAYKHNLFRRLRADKARHLTAHVLHAFGRFRAEGVYATMHGGITMAIQVRLGINNRIRFLGAGGAVQIRQRLPVNFTGQHREIGADLLDVITHASPPRRASIRASTCCFNAASVTDSVSSAAKANTIIFSAARWSIPRERR